jgi:hypothetical protein
MRLKVDTRRFRHKAVPLNPSMHDGGERMLRNGLAVLACVAILGCNGSDINVGTNETIFIRNVLAPPPIGADGTCTYSADPTAAALSGGTLDGSLDSTYTAALLVGDKLPAAGQSGPSRVQIQGINVKIGA